MAAPLPEPAYVRAADLVILFYIYGSSTFGIRKHARPRTVCIRIQDVCDVTGTKLKTRPTCCEQQ